MSDRKILTFAIISILLFATVEGLYLFTDSKYYLMLELGILLGYLIAFLADVVSDLADNPKPNENKESINIKR